MLGGDNLREWIHFGLTSQDINNTAFPLLWKDAIEHEYLPAIINLQHELHDLGNRMEKYSHACQNTWPACFSYDAWEKK